MTELRKSLSLALLAVTLGTAPAIAQAYPDPLAPPAQANAIIQQQNLGTQYNNLQQQQNITVDRLREQQLFTPQPLYGAHSVYQQPLGANSPLFQPQPPALPPRPQRETAAAPAPVAAPAEVLDPTAGVTAEAAAKTRIDRARTNAGSNR